MSRKLTSMTWGDVQEEMSIAGSPEKITKLAKDIENKINSQLDFTNAAELINIMFALDRLKAEYNYHFKKMRKS